MCQQPLPSKHPADLSSAVSIAARTWALHWPGMAAAEAERAHNTMLQ
jgi:hypothetical protein